MSDPAVRRYRSDGMLVLTGRTAKNPAVSTFAFFADVVGYDLAAFLECNSGVLRSQLISDTFGEASQRPLPRRACGIPAIRTAGLLSRRSLN